MEKKWRCRRKGRGTESEGEGQEEGRLCVGVGSREVLQSGEARRRAWCSFSWRLIGPLGCFFLPFSAFLLFNSIVAILCDPLIMLLLEGLVTGMGLLCLLTLTGLVLSRVRHEEK